MGGAKPWQLALMGIGLLGAIVSFLVFNPFVDPIEAQMPKQVVLVDVATGELFVVSTKKRGIAPPLKNPDTGTVSLVPAKEKEDGSGWFVSDRHIGLLHYTDVDPDALEDDGSVPSAAGPPRKIKPLY